MSPRDQQSAASAEWLEEVMDLARAMPLHTPPPIIQQNLRRYFDRWSQARAALDRPKLELRAVLLFDSRLDLAPVGVRGSTDADGSVHLAYTTDHADLVLDVTRVGAGLVRLDGQVLLTEEGQAPIFEAAVIGPSGVRRTIDGDALGRFSLTDVTEDADELQVTNGEVTILAELDLRGQD